MASRFVRPETDRLTLNDGATLVVKRQLTYGERSDAYEAITRGADGKPLPSSLAVEMVIAYLVDWTITANGDGSPVVPWRGLDHANLVATLRAMSPQSFQEIHDAVDAHVAAVDDAEKKSDAAPASLPTSVSAA